jgi:hypothetical protein
MTHLRKRRAPDRAEYRSELRHVTQSQGHNLLHWGGCLSVYARTHLHMDDVVSGGVGGLCVGE